MKRTRLAPLAGAALLLMVGCGKPADAPAPAPAAAAAPDPVAARGKAVYQAHCASCHGPNGHGDGPSAAAAKPRDFAARPWRTAPTAEAVRAATRDGLAGTGMPAFRAALSEGDLDAVTAHVLALAGPGAAGKEPSADEQLLSAAGFVSLLGTVPPALSLVDAKDATTRLSDLKGRLVVLHFWGTGSAEVARQVPALDALERAHAGRLKVLHVCTDYTTPEVAQRELDKLVPGAVTVMEASGAVLAGYESRTAPAVLLVAPDGTAVGRATGAKDWTADPQTKLLARWLPKSVP